MDLASAIGNNTWKFHSEKGVTDRRTDWTIHRAAWSQLKQVSFKKEVGVMVIDLVFWLTVCLILKMSY